MLGRIARFSVRRRRLILVAAAIAFAVSAALGGGVADKLSEGGFEDPNAESTKAEEYLQEHFPAAGTPNLLLLVTADEGKTVDDPDVAAAGLALTQELGGEEHVAFVASYWSTGNAPPLKATGNNRALVLARVEGSDDQLMEVADVVVPKYTRDDGPIQVEVGGQGAVFHDVNNTIEDDLVKAEMIALPITLILLLLVFGSGVAALLPLAIGALSIVGTFFTLLVINTFTDVSVYSLNLTTAMGLGLAIDYSLFIVSRYREELRNGHEPNEAVIRTVRTAGRTVAFAAFTVAASMLALLVFPFYFLRSFAYAGVAVAALAGVYAVVVLPAILAVLGRRVDSLTFWKRSTTPPEEGFWHNMAVRVMKRPLPFATGAIAVLLLLGAPALGMDLGLPDDRVLPEGKPSREVSDVIREEFSSEEAGALSVVIPAGGAAGDIETYARQLAALPDVDRVDASTGSYRRGPDGALVEVPAESTPGFAERFVGDNGGTFVNVVPSIEPLSDEGEALAKAVRETPTPAGWDTQVGGQSAALVDSKDALFDALPLAGGIIAVITFVLLFLMFGSLVVPAKAVVLNLLSLTATFGAMVWIFQEGHLSFLLDFTATGSLAASTPVLMFCIAFGLSMDYEVFLLSRIKEEHDRGASNVQSVAVGLERTGRIVTAAAVLISVVMLAFATSGVSFIKLFGLGLAVAVLMDAFVIRGTLVPAFMRLAGNANWWAPGPLRRFYERFGLSEHVDLDAPPAPDEGPERELVGAGPGMMER